MVEPLRHRQTKEAENTHALSNAAATHPYSTWSDRPIYDRLGREGDKTGSGRKRPVRQSALNNDKQTFNGFARQPFSTQGRQRLRDRLNPRPVIRSP